MSDIVVHVLPQTAPISDLRNRQNEILRMTENGPVVLLSRSKPSAVLISPEQWNAIADALTRNQYKIESDAQSDVGHRLKERGQPVDAFAEIAALAQPLGPADLSVNFDTYTNQMLGDEPAK